MRLPLFIAWRYLLAKKTHNAINIITLISVIGVAVGSIALVVVLSVFNGFEKLILSLFNAFHPDMEITLAEGKTFSMDDFPLEELAEIPGVIHYGEVLEESGLVMYRERQHLVRFRGVDDAYSKITGIDTMLVQGDFVLEQDGRNFIVPGQGVSYVINASIHDLLHPIHLYVPRRGRTAGLHPAQAFRSSSNYASGIFSVQSEYDMEYVIVPLRLMRSLLDYRNEEVTSVVAAIAPGYNHQRIQRQIEEVAGADYVVRNRLQQQDFIYRLMRSEKWAIFFILTFILIIAAFNIIGSLTMLVIEKRRDIAVLRSMGAGREMIRRIFLTEGLLISLTGAITGIAAGALIAWLQMEYGLVPLQAEGVFIIDTYPVKLKGSDLLLTGFTVFCIGFLASLIPLRFIWEASGKPPA